MKLFTNGALRWAESARIRTVYYRRKPREKDDPALYNRKKHENHAARRGKVPSADDDAALIPAAGKV